MGEHEPVAKKSALKALSRVEPDDTYHADLQKELSATENDRCYCLLAVSLIENQIDRVLVQHISRVEIPSTKRLRFNTP